MQQYQILHQPQADIHGAPVGGRTLQTLSLLFPGRVLLTPAEAAHAAFGWATQTARDALYKKTFPLPLVVLPSGKKMVRIDDLAAFLDDQAKRPVKRGRPTKAEQIERAQAQQQQQQEGGEQ